MDSNRTAEDFYQAHPDWFARTVGGAPYRAADKYITCINSPYYDEYLPDVLREIIQRSHPEGFTDNSWAGMGRGNICYCDNCQRKFREKTGQAIPRRACGTISAARNCGSSTIASRKTRAAPIASGRA
jgi:beta-galactosidase GanA